MTALCPETSTSKFLQNIHFTLSIKFEYLPDIGPYFGINNCVNENNKTRASHQLNNNNIISNTIFTHNVLVWIKLVHSCMHTCLCLNHFEMCVYCWMLVSCLDCGEDLNNYCDCCACAGCCDQGKWHSCPIFILLLH